MGSPRILFLHGMDGNAKNEKHHLIKKCVGKENVKAPNLHLKQTILLFICFFVILIVASFVSACLAVIYLNWYLVCVIFLILIGFFGFLYFYSSRLTTNVMLLRAISIAEKAFRDFKPNIIAASSFGAVVALEMKVPKFPLLLFSPAQDVYSKYMAKVEKYSIKEFPFVLLIHGELDKVVPLSHSQRLIGTMPHEDRVKLEVVAADNHLLKSVSINDVQTWIDEVYTRGRHMVFKMSADGYKNLEPSFFEDKVDKSGYAYDKLETIADIKESSRLLDGV